MRAGSRPLWLATVGIAAAALGFALYRAGRRAAPQRELLHAAALDGVVGQPSRLILANLPRPRLRRRRRDA